MEHQCPWWLVYTFDNPIRRLFHNPKVIFEPYVKRGMTVMDIGCGRGFSSIAMARIVGETGKVISIDMQQQMLNMLKKRAARAGLGARIQLHKCEAESLCIDERADFVNAFWMVHETPDSEALFKEIFQILNSGGHLLVVEPKGHVSDEAFQEMIEMGENIGFEVQARPKIAFSKSVVLRKS